MSPKRFSDEGADDKGELDGRGGGGESMLNADLNRLSGGGEDEPIKWQA